MQVFADGARGELATSISPEDTTFQVINGSVFNPATVGTKNLDEGNWFKAVIQDDERFEIVYVRSHELVTSPDTFSNVLRGQDGTTAQAFPVGSVVGIRPTAGDMDKAINQKVDKELGKGLSTEDYTTAEKNKLAGLANYSHPPNHPPSIIAQDANNRFVTDAEKAAWNGKVGANGSGASGTWGISISGNAATASNAEYATYSNAANAVWTSAGINSSVSGTDYSAMVKNAGGTGDSGVAALAFYCNEYAIKVYSRADGYFGLGGWSSVAWRWYSDPNGNMVASGNVTAYSDPRLKRDFTRIADPLGVLAKLDGGTFYWRDGFAHTSIKAGKRDYGILADQVEAVMPEIVSESIEIEGEKYKAVAYDKLVPVLIEAVKALDVRVKELEASRAAT